MNLVVHLKLLPTPEQAGLLKETQSAFTQACNDASATSFLAKQFTRGGIHRLAYRRIRDSYGLPARFADRIVGLVSNAYKRNKTRRATFRAGGAVVYDCRSLTYKQDDTLSILTNEGRQTIPYTCRDPRLELRRGQADLVERDGQWYLLQCIEVQPEDPISTSGHLGVDLGIRHIAADSDGAIFSGESINGHRRRHRRLHSRLQSKGTKSAKRLLKKRRRKERRFARDVNHCISKKLVAKAKGTYRGIALEDLKGIRERVTVRKSQRSSLHSWSFGQLRQFIEYKAELAGVPVVTVDPRNTSRTCPECGHIDKRNRPSQAVFSCVSCGFSGHADTIAAVNIRRRADADQPYADVA